MKQRATSLLASFLWVLFVVGVGLGVSLSVAQGTASDLPEIVLVLAAFAAFATVGAVVASRRPRNPIGWVFLAIGILTAIGALGEPLSESALPERPPGTAALTAWTPSPAEGPLPFGAVLGAWTQSWFWYPLFALSTLFTILLFPSGLPSRRWRPVLWVSAFSVTSITAMAALTPTLDVGGRSVPNPIRLDALIGTDIEESLPFQVFFVVFVLCILASVVSLIVRYRRALGETRLQLKWFVYAAVLFPLSLVPSIAVPGYDESDASGVVFGLVVSLLPISVGIAIFRYRLYEIDRIINRTLVYGSLTLLLGGLYVGVVVGLGSLVGDSGLLVAASTLLVAALFRPVRARVQNLIDRRFYRKKYDAARTLEAFSARLRDEVDLDALSQELVALVEETVQPTHASLWLRPQEARR